jgi:hypothetical protein
MRAMGFIFTGLLVVSAVGATLVFIRLMPELRRYLKIRQM